MHPCLAIDEIVAIICSSLSRKDLLSVGLTCHQFKEPALSSLWKELPMLRPFLKLLPEDTWQERTTAPNPQLYLITLGRPITSLDLRTTKKYASCVRSLRISSRDRVHSALLESAVHAFGGEDVFPRLRTLAISYPGPVTPGSYLKFTNTLLTSHLTHFELKISSVKTESKDVITTLSRLGINCPSIISFKFEWSGYTDDLLESVSTTICSWSSLRLLEILSLLPKAVIHLSKLDHFEDLSCNLPPVDLSPGFQSLRRLHLDSQTMPDILDFIHASQSSVLGDMLVDIGIFATLEEWEEFFAVVSQRSSGAKELRLRVQENYAYGADQGNCVLKADVLRPLLLARNIVILDLAEVHYFQLDDSFIEELAIASPRLIKLYIGTAADMVDTPTLTPRAYLHALKHCPKLTALGLVVDTADTKEISEQRFTDWGVQRRTEPFQLHVGCSLVGKRKVMVAFLFAIFAQVNIIVSDELDSEYADGWARVQYLLQCRAAGAEDWSESDSEDEESHESSD